MRCKLSKTNQRPSNPRILKGEGPVDAVDLQGRPKYAIADGHGSMLLAVASMAREHADGTSGLTCGFCDGVEP